MPLYEYQCDACAHRFEVIQKFSDAPIDVCPKCGGAVSKLLSSPAIQFKGSGFYLTDYGRAGQDRLGQRRRPARTSRQPASSQVRVEDRDVEDRVEIGRQAATSAPSASTTKSD